MVDCKAVQEKTINYFFNPMNWKELLKPTKNKIIVALVIFILFVPFVYVDNELKMMICKGSNCSVRYKDAIKILPSEFEPNFMEKPRVQIWKPIIYQSLTFYGYISYTYLTAGIILSYLASCTIILLYTKIRNKI